MKYKPLCLCFDIPILGIQLTFQQLVPTNRQNHFTYFYTIAQVQNIYYGETVTESLAEAAHKTASK